MSLLVTDMSGKEMMRLMSDQMVSSMTTSVAFDVSALPAGMYLLLLKTAHGVAVSRFAGYP